MGRSVKRHHRSSVLLGLIAVGAGSLVAGSAVATGSRPPAAVPTTTTSTTPPTTTTTEPATATAAEAATGTVLTASPASTRVGESVTFVATVTLAAGSAVNGGSVTFRDGDEVLHTDNVDPSGVASFDTSLLPVGLHSISASFNGTPEFAASTSNTMAYPVRRWTSRIAVTASPGQVVVGEEVTVTVTVSSDGGTPDGEVDFFEASNPVAVTVVTLDGGTAKYATSQLAVGSHEIVVNYEGSSNFESSQDRVAVQVDEPPDTTSARAATTTVLDVEPDSAFSGEPVTFTASITVSGSGDSVPGGTVGFAVDGVELETVEVVDGSAEFVTSSLAVGTRTATAAYNPAAGFAASDASSSVVVLPPRTETMLTSSANPSVLGQSVTFTATVTTTVDGNPVTTGTITFLDGDAELDTVGLDSRGVATYSVVPPGSGPHTIRALYFGADQFSASGFTVIQDVTRRTTQTVLTSSPNPSALGDEVTFTAHVFYDGIVPDGQVVFAVDGSDAFTGDLDSNGLATFRTSTFEAGPHVITADYQGSIDFSPSSTTLTQHVGGSTSRATITTLDISPDPSLFGHRVTFTASVTVADTGEPLAEGTVTFFLEGDAFDTVFVTNGSAVLTDGTLEVGSYLVTATYNPTGDHEPSSAEGTLVVIETGPRRINLTSSNNPSAVGEAVTFTAQVSYPLHPETAPIGSLAFFVDGRSPGIPTSELDSSGKATFTTSALTEGVHTITALYSTPAGTGEIVADLAQQVGEPSTSTTTPSPSTTTPPPSTTTPPPSTTAPSPPSTSVPSPATPRTQTTTRLTSSVNPSALGAPVTFRVEVSRTGAEVGPLGIRGSDAERPAGTGSVTIGDGDRVLTVVPLEHGRASFTTSSLTVGSHSITADFSGTATTAPSSDTVVQRVNAARGLPVTL